MIASVIEEILPDENQQDCQHKPLVASYHVVINIL